MYGNLIQNPSGSRDSVGPINVNQLLLKNIFNIPDNHVYTYHKILFHLLFNVLYLLKRL